jgi:hypothetical protein
MTIFELFEHIKKNEGVIKIERPKDYSSVPHKSLEDTPKNRYEAFESFFSFRIDQADFFFASIKYIKHPEPWTKDFAIKEFDRIIKNVDEEYYYIDAYELFYIDKNELAPFVFEGFIPFFERIRDIVRYEIEHRIIFDSRRANRMVAKVYCDKNGDGKQQKVECLEDELNGLIYKDDHVFNWLVNVSKEMRKDYGDIGFEISEELVLDIEEYAQVLRRKVANMKK